MTEVDLCFFPHQEVTFEAISKMGICNKKSPREQVGLKRLVVECGRRFKSVLQYREASLR